MYVEAVQLEGRSVNCTSEICTF